MSAEKKQSEIVSFGHNKLCKHLATRLDRQFKKPKRNIEPSLVIGLFGEWGSGKSHLLSLLEKNYKNYNIQENQITVPILFNPWRFEKEEHLIIPLMKTTELALQECENWLSSQDPEAVRAREAAEWAGNLVKGTGKLFGVSVLAFISALKTKVSIPGLSEADFDGKKLIDTYKEAYEKKDNLESLSDLTSHYFNFQQMLKEATGHSTENGDKKLNLLFLVDDIDRCLPEKAVEMLESIKLFLDVEGCAFVLAVDDEVVERGIVHRYRDYIFQQQNSENSLLTTAPPITGAEYLEKIIHLPFRLPLPTKNEIKTFLLDQFPEIFKPQDDSNKKSLLNGEERDEKDSELKGKESDLLDLFVKAVPPVPRKLIRAVELFDLQREIMRERGLRSFHELTLARLVILQLLVPDIYRFGRQWKGFLHTLELWEKDYPGGWVFPGVKFKDENKLVIKEQVIPLYNLVLQHSNPRSGFNIKNVIDINDPCDKNMSIYFGLSEEIVSAKTGTTMSVDLEAEDRPLLQLDDESTFINLMTSKRPDGWTSAAGMPGIDSGVMGADLFGKLKKGVGSSININSEYCIPEWLSIIKPLLTGDQQEELWGGLDKTLAQSMIDQDLFKSAKQRLIFGNCLDALGDIREGVGINDEGLPDIIWKDVSEGEFLYGVEKKKRVLKNSFKISKYPITNQQFQSFIYASDADDPKWWKDLKKQDFELPGFSQGNRPCVEVSWYQAIAFTRWLSEKLGKNIQLPTEQQWEKAARGPNGNEYPWKGKFNPDYLNSREGENSLEETSSVGLYPKGESHYGVLDMSGNVWEWCLNKYDKPDDLNIDKSDVTRTFRGGSWYFITDNVRCAIRSGDHPINRNYLVGFRVVCSE